MQKVYQTLLVVFYVALCNQMVLYGTGFFGLTTVLSLGVNFFLNLISFHYVYRTHTDSHVQKLHITRDSRKPDHLISHILQKMEQRQFTYLQR